MPYEASGGKAGRHAGRRQRQQRPAAAAAEAAEAARQMRLCRDATRRDATQDEAGRPSPPRAETGGAIRRVQYDNAIVVQCSAMGSAPMPVQYSTCMHVLFVVWYFLQQSVQHGDCTGVLYHTGTVLFLLFLRACVRKFARALARTARVRR